MKDALGFPQSLLLLGGTSEIGLATARALVSRRTRTVVLAGRRPAALEAPAVELRALGAERVEVMAFDADDTASHADVVARAFTGYGDIDVTLLAFGVLGDQRSAEDDPEHAAALLRTNLVGAASVGLHVAQHLRRQGHGTLAVLSSVAGERARRSNFVYGSSKAGMDAFFEGLGDSLVGSGANVLLVRPGFVHTRMTAGLDPPPFSTTPEEVAEVIVKALQSGSEQAWAPPHLRYVMSGIRHLPRSLFRRIEV
ncbi:MAG: decaprenylphospho-beta-D-erythro-pentofuranosid-2-ulose 2-reductase [Actinomycetota bacterium]|nr:decaprenylphospho-beta-D-erythro-pentofuranosid-2-ulose 2-reductase [Actinomycetota bacterium]